MALSKGALEALELSGTDVDPALLKEMVIVTKDGPSTMITYDEDAINRRLNFLKRALVPGTPQHLRDAYNEIAAYHWARRQHNARRGLGDLGA